MSREPFRAPRADSCGVPRRTLDHYHSRIHSQDPDAVNELATVLLLEFPSILGRRFPLTSDDVLVDAIEDAFLEYVRMPDRFDSSKTSLRAFLCLAALRNVANSHRATLRRRRRESLWFAEHLRLASSRDGSRHVQMADLHQLLFDVAGSNAIERRAALLWLSGTKSTRTLASVLGLDQLSDAERRSEVKRFKDRITKRVGRVGSHG